MPTTRSTQSIKNMLGGGITNAISRSATEIMKGEKSLKNFYEVCSNEVRKRLPYQIFSYVMF